MTDVERFFRQLVSALGADGGRAGPIPLADISGTILPYRAHRRALDVDSSEDYELVLLRLAAGEGGFAYTEPAETLARFQAELATPHPDLAVLGSDPSATVTLVPERVSGMDRTPAAAHAAYAPPAAAVGAERIAEPAYAEVPDGEDTLQLDVVRMPPPAAAAARTPRPADDDEPEARVHCGYCGGGLPDGRIVKFCPHCGQSQTITHCPDCRGEVELGWRHCIECGVGLAN